MGGKNGKVCGKGGNVGGKNGKDGWGCGGIRTLARRPGTQVRGGASGVFTSRYGVVKVLVARGGAA